MKITIPFLMTVMFLSWSVAAPIKDGLHLNDGAKWEADAKTHESFESMAHILKEDAGQAHAELAGKLETVIHQIITHCSMQGEPHNQLHHVLHPIIESVAALKTDTETASRKKILAHIQAKVDAYFAHFQAPRT